EMVSWSQPGQFALPPCHDDSPFDDHEELVAPLSFSGQKITLRWVDLVDEAGHLAEVAFRQIGEEGHGAEQSRPL
ncbi:MAG: hypothetical protein GWO22_19225, partial [Actinobacteria bacterium]|nr:hypothetical protein [Actinomycetota bacterium]